MIVSAPEFDFISFSEMPLLRSLTSVEHRPNVLVTCPHGTARSALSQLRGLCTSPCHICLLPGGLNLPRSDQGTLLLYDVAELTMSQQIVLSDWMERRADVQVMSVTQAPLLDRVRDGRFLEGLFYRLNTVSVSAAGSLR